MEWNMGNDDKIKGTGKDMQTNEQRHKEVLLFLNEELNRLQTTNSTDSYDLVREYAKTKKNKSPFSFLLLFGTLVIVFLAAWGISAGIKKQNQEIKVNLAEFEGLNIKNLLDSVSKVQTNYDNAMKNRTNIISDRDLAIKKAEETRDNELFLIESLTLSKKEENKRKTAVLEEYEKTLQQIKDEYDPQIMLAENELAEYKKQLDEYDTSKIEAARQQEQALDSERRLHQLEIDKISENYEQRIKEIQDSYAQERQNNADNIRRSVTEVSQKYLQEIETLDPDLTNTSSQGIVHTVNASTYEPFDSEKFVEENGIKDESVIISLTAYQQDYNRYNSVTAPFQTIPYKKSLPDYFTAAQNLVDKMGATFGDSVLKFNKEKVELNSRIATLNKQMAQQKADNEAEVAGLKQDFAKQKAELAEDFVQIYDGILASAKASAVVISAHDKEHIRIYIVPAQRDHITENGVGAEIKASKGVKGIVKPIADEPGFYLFGNALDKAGNPVDFDFDLISAGQIVKISAK